MLSKTLINFLEKNKIKYEAINHRTVYTAWDKATTLTAHSKITPAMVGKTVIVSFDGKDHAIGLIPANKNLDKQKVLATFNKLRQKTKQTAYKKIDFITEKWMKANIKNAKIGATPPFGAFYNLPFFIDNAMIKQVKIIVNAGDYETSLKLSPTNLIKLDKNTLKGNFSQAKT